MKMFTFCYGILRNSFDHINAKNIFYLTFKFLISFVRNYTFYVTFKALSIVCKFVCFPMKAKL